MDTPQRSLSIRSVGPSTGRSTGRETGAYVRSSLLAPRPAFTLVELLVVITIIGILASLITVAAVGALRKAQQTRTKVELNEITDAFEAYKGKNNAYPPNLQTDFEAAQPVLDSNQVLIDLHGHLKQVSQRLSESPNLERVLTGYTATGADAADYPQRLPGGMTAGEAVVFWLSGFSGDPRYPISGEGGPSYAIPGPNDAGNYQLDPIESRHWVYPFVVSRLGPRTEDGYFDDSKGRHIEYRVTINGVPQWRRINFWQYVPDKSTQPYLYFDTSRHPAGVPAGGEILGPYHPPAATEPTGMELHVHAVTKRNPVYRDDRAGQVSPIVFVNPNKFQVLHCGIDDSWGTDLGVGFELMAAHGVKEAGLNNTLPENYLLYPTGPFTADIADTIVNFTTGTLEDSQQ